MNPNKSKFTIYSIIQEILKIKIKVEKYTQGKSELQIQNKVVTCIDQKCM